jgi:hypothetical protein
MQLMSVEKHSLFFYLKLGLQNYPGTHHIQDYQKTGIVQNPIGRHTTNFGIKVNLPHN